MLSSWTAQTWEWHGAGLLFGVQSGLSRAVLLHNAMPQAHVECSNGFSSPATRAKGWTSNLASNGQAGSTCRVRGWLEQEMQESSKNSFLRRSDHLWSKSFFAGCVALCPVHWFRQFLQIDRRLDWAAHDALELSVLGLQRLKHGGILSTQLGACLLPLGAPSVNKISPKLSFSLVRFYTITPCIRVSLIALSVQFARSCTICTSLQRLVELLVSGMC